MLTTQTAVSAVDTDSVTKPRKIFNRRSSFTSTSSSSNINNGSTPGFLMKILKRRTSDAVKNTSIVLDDYANLLSRDSNFLAGAGGAVGGGDSATVATQSSSLTESFHASANISAAAVPVPVVDGTSSMTMMTPRPSIVSHASVGTFLKREVELGKLLGKGAFSKVYEITSIVLLDDEHNNNNNNKGDVSNMDSDNSSSDFNAASASAGTARAIMSQKARQGQYAMKRLRKKLLRRPRDFTRAAANLVVEAQILSRLNDHPHIVKLRGSALGGASSFEAGEHDGYFLILDRVAETLQDRIYTTWATARANPCRNKSLDPTQLLLHKTQYAWQLASALQHLHERRLIYRDLKPANIGFAAADTDNNNTNNTTKSDELHSIQIFDFGMARELPPALGLANELFHMTQNAGTKPYTAPEVVTNGLYNAKADVYSWSMVVYEIFAEQVPFAHLVTTKGSSSSKKPVANRDYLQAVYVDGERPTFVLEEEQETTAAAAVSAGKVPTKELRELLNKCWQPDLFHRPTMDEVVGDLQTIMDQLPRSNDMKKQ